MRSTPPGPAIAAIFSHGDGVAELGLSVMPGARGKGLGAAIFRYAVAQASRDGAGRLFMHCLTGNRAVLSIARSAGMSIGSSGAERDAYQVVPDHAELVGRLIDDPAVFQAFTARAFAP